LETKSELYFHHLSIRFGLWIPPKVVASVIKAQLKEIRFLETI
jgi:hypothetical protein